MTPAPLNLKIIQEMQNFVKFKQIPSPPPPPPYTLHTCIQYTFYTGKGGELNQREGEKLGNSSQSWAENTNMTDSISSL